MTLNTCATKCAMHVIFELIQADPHQERKFQLLMLTNHSTKASTGAFSLPSSKWITFCFKRRVHGHEIWWSYGHEKLVRAIVERKIGGGMDIPRRCTKPVSIRSRCLWQRSQFFSEKLIKSTFRWSPRDHPVKWKDRMQQWLLEHVLNKVAKEIITASAECLVKRAALLANVFHGSSVLSCF